MQIMQNRRRFIAGLSAAGATSMVGWPSSLHAEPPPETTTIHIAQPGAACNGPLAAIEDLLHEEGFVEVRRLPSSTTAWNLLPDGEVDIDMMSWSDFLPLVDAGRPVTVLSGIHAGCLELRANDSIRSIVDLRGKRIGINNFGVTDHMLVSLMAAYVGLKPADEIDWVVNPDVSQVELFEAGKVDAFIGFPPEISQPCAARCRACRSSTLHAIVRGRTISAACCLANTGLMRASTRLPRSASLRALLRADRCVLTGS